jgi:transcription initiation factor TFIID subunit TAF12
MLAFWHRQLKQFKITKVFQTPETAPNQRQLINQKSIKNSKMPPFAETCNSSLCKRSATPTRPSKKPNFLIGTQDFGDAWKGVKVNFESEWW